MPTLPAIVNHSQPAITRPNLVLPHTPYSSRLSTPAITNPPSGVPSYQSPLPPLQSSISVPTWPTATCAALLLCSVDATHSLHTMLRHAAAVCHGRSSRNMIPSRGVPVFTFNPWEFLAEVVCARENIPTETFRCVSASLPWTCALIRILAAAH